MQLKNGRHTRQGIHWKKIILFVVYVCKQYITRERQDEYKKNESRDDKNINDEETKGKCMVR